ncbi:hypothetical protein K445DRAFT_288267 [Daldinia sp. EC12]|nr:hypothetical protein K445DRAFT_288267 [Daldinia sp. EC12]
MPSSCLHTFVHSSKTISNMYALAVITFASAALAVPFPLRRSYATDAPSFPTFPTAPSSAPTGGSTALPTVVEPPSSYHATVTYSTSSSDPTSAVPFPTSNPETFVTSLSSTLHISQPVPTPSASQPGEAPPAFPTFPASSLSPFPTFSGTVPGTAPGTVPTGGFPQQPSTSQYSVTISYSRTNEGYPVATPN